MSSRLELHDISRVAIQVLETRPENISKSIVYGIEKICDTDPVALRMLKNFYQFWIHHEDWIHTFDDLNELALHLNIEKQSQRKFLKLLVILCIDALRRQPSEKESLKKKNLYKINKIMTSKEVLFWQERLQLRAVDFLPYFAIYTIDSTGINADLKKQFKISAEDFFKNRECSRNLGKKFVDNLLALSTERSGKEINKFENLLHKIFCQNELGSEKLAQSFIKPWVKYWFDYFFKLDVGQDLRKYLQEHIVKHIYNNDSKIVDFLTGGSFSIQDAVAKTHVLSSINLKKLDKVTAELSCSKLTEHEQFLFNIESFKMYAHLALMEPYPTKEIKDKFLNLLTINLKAVTEKSDWQQVQKVQFVRKMFSKFFRISLKTPVTQNQSELIVLIDLIEKYLNFDKQLAEANIYQYALAESRNNFKLMSEIAAREYEIYDSEIYTSLILNFAPRFVEKHIIMKDFVHVFIKKMSVQNRINFYNLLEKEVLRSRNSRLCDEIESIQTKKSKEKADLRSHSCSKYSKMNVIHFLCEVYRNIPIPELSSISNSDVELLTEVAFHQAFSGFLSGYFLSPSLVSLKDKILEHLVKIEKECKQGNLRLVLCDFKLYLNKAISEDVNSQNISNKQNVLQKNVELGDFNG